MVIHCWKCRAVQIEPDYPTARVSGNQSILDAMRRDLASLEPCDKCGAGAWPETRTERALAKMNVQITAAEQRARGGL